MNGGPWKILKSFARDFAIWFKMLYKTVSSNLVNNFIQNSSNPMLLLESLDTVTAPRYKVRLKNEVWTIHVLQENITSCCPNRPRGSYKKLYMRTTRAPFIVKTLIPLHSVRSSASFGGTTLVHWNCHQETECTKLTSITLQLSR